MGYGSRVMNGSRGIVSRCRNVVSGCGVGNGSGDMSDMSYGGGSNVSYVGYRLGFVMPYDALGGDCSRWRVMRHW